MSYRVDSVMSYLHSVYRNSKRTLTVFRYHTLLPYNVSDDNTELFHTDENSEK